MEKVRIEIEAELNDKASKQANNLEKKLNRLGKNKINIDANTNKADSKIKKTRSIMDRLTKAHNMEVGIVDRATSKINSIKYKTKSLARSVIKIPISIIDKATGPLRKVFNYATSFKGIATGIIAGKVFKGLIASPLQLADQYESSMIAFENILGSQKEAQGMMKEIQKFAGKTSFDTAGVTNATRSLLMMGVSDKKTVFKDLQAIGDAVSAVGGNTETINGVTLALSQMAAKGKVSSEELNQLAERGIMAKKYLMEAFNTDNFSDIEKMTRSGALNAKDAIGIIMKGMREDKSLMGSMSKNANKTFAGLKEQITDTFETGILTKWGRGIQQGILPGMEKMVKHLDDNEDRINKIGDRLFSFGENLGTGTTSFATSMIGNTLNTLESFEFKQGSLSQKISLLWDNTLGDPISQWWDTSGRAGAVKAATGLTKILVEGIGNGLKEIGSGYLDNLKTLLPGGEEATSGDFMSAGIMTFLGGKVLGNLFNGALGGFDFIKGILGGKNSTDGTDGISSLLGQTVGTMSISAGVVNVSGGTNGLTDIVKRANPNEAIPMGGNVTKHPWLTKLGGGLSNFAGKLGAGAVGKGAVTIGGASLLGGALGLGGVISGIKDIIKGKKWEGGTKLGMVGAGAATGAAVGSVVPVVGTAAGALIGAGAGGLSALFGGNKVGKFLESKFSDGGKAANEFGNTLQGTNVNATALGSNFVATGSLAAAMGNNAVTAGMNTMAMGNNAILAGGSVQGLGDTSVLAQGGVTGMGTSALGAGGALGGLAGAAFSAMSALMMASVTANMASASMRSASANINRNSTGLGPRRFKMPGHASGGIFNTPHIAQFAEDGTEAVIPMTKSQGPAILSETAKRMGMNLGNSTSVHAPIILNVNGADSNVVQQIKDNLNDVADILIKKIEFNTKASLENQF